MNLGSGVNNALPSVPACDPAFVVYNDGSCVTARSISVPSAPVIAVLPESEKVLARCGCLVGSRAAAGTSGTFGAPEVEGPDFSRLRHDFFFLSGGYRLGSFLFESSGIFVTICTRTVLVRHKTNWRQKQKREHESSSILTTFYKYVLAVKCAVVAAHSSFHASPGADTP